MGRVIRKTAYLWITRATKVGAGNLLVQVPGNCSLGVGIESKQAHYQTVRYREGVLQGVLAFSQLFCLNQHSGIRRNLPSSADRTELLEKHYSTKL